MIDNNEPKKYKLIGADGKEYLSEEKGTLGGYRRKKIYGRLDCPSALRHIAKGEYVKYRVFFKDEETAIAAGYRPCAVCMKDKYKKWKDKQEGKEDDRKS
ncbi:Ada metal-binding domain-containing protein [Ruminococcus flavefaciens]|uniref:Ada metal-binding domain-containing protein n=1 Tax=Ruminococcus flavefaciens TaxID=1265 RepID=UPI0026F174D4|nr:Ada metal-binding domain-containing protein [Ruminococcus flavefaciens]